MKKIFSLILVVILTACAFAGCGGEKETVSTDGSTSMNKVIGALGEAFEADNGITVTYNATGSGAGIQAVQEGRCDIGLASRNLKDEEKSKGLEGTVLAYDGIAVIVNPKNPVSDLDVETIAKIYTGEIKNWKEIGGNDTEIVLIGREAGSGTRDGFEDITDTKDKCKYRQELTSTGDVITTVSSNPGAIGYASLASIKDTVKALTVDGVAPSESTIKDGSYVVQRPFVLVTKKDTALSESAQKFFDYITSEVANEIISAAGNPTSGAFVEGAYLVRRMTDEERVQQQALKDMIQKQAASGMQRDSLNLATVEMESTYFVGIDLEAALQNPGSDADIVLRDGDVITIPEYNGTVRVMGAVTYPNTITFKEKKNLKYYVDAAGGYDNRARKNRSFVIYMNGMVASGKRAEVRPGCIIIVPSKSQTEPIKWSEVISLISSTASTTAVVMSAISIAQK